MPDLTEDSVRRIVREETAARSAELRELIDNVQSTFNEKIDHVSDVLTGKIDTVLTKMDGFAKGLEAAEQEKTIADAQLERRIEQLEGRATAPLTSAPVRGAAGSQFTRTVSTSPGALTRSTIVNVP